jgi:hypothetical protein
MTSIDLFTKFLQLYPQRLILLFKLSQVDTENFFRGIKRKLLKDNI